MAEHEPWSKNDKISLLAKRVKHLKREVVRLYRQIKRLKKQSAAIRRTVRVSADLKLLRLVRQAEKERKEL